MLCVSAAMGASVLQYAAQPTLPFMKDFYTRLMANLQLQATTTATATASTRSKLPYPQFEEELTSPRVLKHHVLNTFPHDRQAFTQGLFIHDGAMFESTGLYGQSSVRKVDLQSGKVLQMSRFSDSIFGEGIAMHSDGKIYGLSWKEGVGFRIDPATLNIEKTYKLPISEGWGITSDGTNLIVTDSSQTLTFLDTDFQPVKQVVIKDPENGKDVPFVNEMEYINGKIYGNVYGLDYIAVIDPTSGNVENWIDCRGLWKDGSRSPNNVFNGIAYDKERNKLYVTGKQWSALYEIQTLK